MIVSKRNLSSKISIIRCHVSFRGVYEDSGHQSWDDHFPHMFLVSSFGILLGRSFSPRFFGGGNRYGRNRRGGERGVLGRCSGGECQGGLEKLGCAICWWGWAGRGGFEMHVPLFLCFFSKISPDQKGLKWRSFYQTFFCWWCQNRGHISSQSLQLWVLRGDLDWFPKMEVTFIGPGKVICGSKAGHLQKKLEDDEQDESLMSRISDLSTKY